MILIDGSFGEGGGQILRTSLALSLVTGQPFRIEKIRAGRKNPGLLRQHLTALTAAARIGNARVEGDQLGSQQLTFYPNIITSGAYQFAVGTAGSATLVLQTVLPALLSGLSGTTTLTLEGGTHNPFAPPFDFLQKSFLPLVNRMGVNVKVSLERYGFFPAGGGKFIAQITPAARLRPLELIHRGKLKTKIARALVSHLPFEIAERELAVFKRKLNLTDNALCGETIKTSPGPGNVVLVELTSDHHTEVFSGFGERGVSAESVANSVINEVRNYIAAEAVVGEHLADQLLLPMALAGSGAFTTLPLTEHSRTNIEIIQKFLAVKFDVVELNERAVKVTIR